MRFKFLILLTCLILGIGYPLWAADHSIWDGILKANVKDNGDVDYFSIRIAKGGDIYQYLTFLEDENISKASDNSKMAFWINAYNAHLIRLILSDPSLTSMEGQSEMFKRKFRVAKEKVSLNNIVNRILRLDSEKGGPLPGISVSKVDPRIHFALSQGTKGGPRLWNRAYTEKNIQEGLQHAAVRFVNDSELLKVDNGILYAPQFLKTYISDFENAGGAVSFLESFINPKERSDAQTLKSLLETEFPASTTFVVNWELNQVPPK